MKYEWKYGENDNQKYYDVTVGKDYLCVFANKWNPNTWLGSYNSMILSILVYTFFTRMFDFMLPLVVKYSIVAA